MIGDPVEAPSPRGNESKWRKELADIMEHPNQWFEYKGVARSLTHYLQTQFISKRFPDIYVTTRNHSKDRKRCDMYLIYEPIDEADSDF